MEVHPRRGLFTLFRGRFIIACYITLKFGLVMNKLKVGVIFGGKSTEHDVSVVSGSSIIKNLDKSKYEIFPIYIDKKR